MSRILPEGSEAVAPDETILWTGKPILGGIARQVFHVRPVVAYLAVLAMVNLASAHSAGFRADWALVSTGWAVLPAAAAAVLIYAMAWVLVMTTHYTITDKRVIMQVGVALPIALTLPLAKIRSADVKLYNDGSGDIPLALGDQKLAYLLIWPHARPWRFKRPEPMLRAVSDARQVAAVLSRALLKVSPTGEATVLAPVPRPEPRGEPGIATA